MLKTTINTFTQRKGYDDLKNHSPWNISEWGYKSFHSSFPDITEDNFDAAVYKQRAELWNRNYILSLKRSGEYGAEYYPTIETVDHPMFDNNVNPVDPPLTSYGFTILDFSEANLLDNIIKPSI